MAVLKRRPRSRRAWLGTLLVLTSCAGLTAATSPSEYQVKAVFLFNFTRFVEWPPQSFADPHAPFVIGVLGRDPFGSALDEAIRDETVNGHTLLVRRFQSLADLQPCQILFIDRSAGPEAFRSLSSVERQGTLTVSDIDAYTEPGGIISFVSEGRKIRLRINVDSARGAGLTISSKLLRPAQVVGSEAAR